MRPPPVTPPWWRRAFCARHVGAGATSLAIHLTVAILVVWMSVRVVRTGIAAAAAARPSTSPLALFAQATSSSNAAPGAERPPTKPLIESRTASGPATLGLRIEGPQSTVAFPGYTIDVEKVTSRAAALFPFLTRQLAFNAEEHQPKPAPRRMINPFATPGAMTADRPLLITDAEVQKLIDQAWSRRERWAPFQTIRALAEQHSPNVGQVAPLIRGFVTQNAFQPYVEPEMRDPRIWTQLALAADHALFLDFIVDYTSKHPGTRAAVELLFFLDVLTQSSQETLRLLLEINPTRDLAWTRRANPAAFQAFAAIHDHYAKMRETLGLTTHKALLRHYDRIRLEILTSIIQTAPEGYRVSDARYLIGELHWRRDRRAEARRVWGEMEIDPRNRYTWVASSLLDAVKQAPEFDAHTVNGILDMEHDRWISASRARLLQFGYRLDSF